MVVADRATHCQPHERGAIGLGALARDVYAQLLGNGATFVAAHAQANIAAADERIEILRRHQVAGDLLHRKLIEWLVAVERTDQIVAIGPDVAAVVEVQSVGVGIARVVEPVSRPLLAKGGLARADRLPDVHRPAG